MEQQAAVEKRREDAARQRLGGLDLKYLDEQTRFINAKLAERAFSWSRLLDELESILADDVRLVSVTPDFGDDGDIDLTMDFRTKSSDGMITTINRMNADPQFRDAFPSNETQEEGGGFAFALSAKYIPANDTPLQRTKVAR